MFAYPQMQMLAMHLKMLAMHMSLLQVFVLDGTRATAEYIFLQDLANLNMPAGVAA